MILAEPIIIVWVVGALLIGFVGFFVVLLGALARLLRLVFSPFIWMRRRLRRRRHGWHTQHMPGGCWQECTPVMRPPPLPAAIRVCGQARCGHVNPGSARYCARCGKLLGPASGVDSYG